MSFGVLVSVEVDVRTVRRGDEIMIGGQVCVVRDMAAVSAGKRLDFTDGTSFTMRPRTILWAARRVDPRRSVRHLRGAPGF